MGNVWRGTRGRESIRVIVASRRKSKRGVAPHPAPAFHTSEPRWLVPALAALVLLAGAWAYAPSFDGVFVLDDIRALVRNPTIQPTSPLTAALSPPPDSTVSGRPVANLSFAINRAVASPESARWTFHAGNLLTHLAAALVLFGVVGRTLRSERLRSTLGTSATAVAFAVALVWVVHPLTTSAVTYMVQRVESLMSLFFLLTLYCAIRADESPVPSGFSRKHLFVAAAVVACALGMGTKEVMIGAPLVMLLWDWLFRTSRRPRWGVFGALAATWLVLAFLVYHERRAPSLTLGAGTSYHYLLTQTAVIAHYLQLAVVPTGLVFLYTWPLATSLGEVAPAASLICALAALTLFGLSRRHPAAFAGAAFFIILAPSSSVLPIVTEVAAEHRMYLPLAALVALVVTLAAAYAHTWRQAPAALAVLAMVLAVPLGVETRARNRVYADDELLWADTVAKEPANPRARVAYGSVLAMKQKVAEAAAQFQTAVDLNEADPIAQARLGSALAAGGQFDRAMPHLERALAIRPDDVEAHRTLGHIYAMRHDDARALPHLVRAADAVDDPALVLRIAAILAESPDPMVRDPRRALTFAERAVALTSRRDPVALAVLSSALSGVGRFAEAAATVREALPLARAQGNPALVTELEQRARAYDRQLP